MSERLFTTRFFIMCAFTFTVFISAFQLLPTAPFRIQELGGSTFSSGLFLGFLTFASASSAPFTGAVSDRIGRRRTLMVASSVILLCAVAYGMTTSYQVMLGIALVHGVVWSGLLSASAAYLTNLVPEGRRAEGISYWGLSTIAAIAVAPPVGFWIMHNGGWSWICIACGMLSLLMGVIAWVLPEDTEGQTHHPHPKPSLMEWSVLAKSLTLFLYSFGYGAITSFSAVYLDALSIKPESLYLTVLAVVTLATRPVSGRVADRIGHRKILIPCLLLITAGLALLSFASTLTGVVISAIVFGAGFGSAYPVFVAYVMKNVHPDQRGSAFGSILSAFDIGIGIGSIVAGWIIQHFSFAVAFGLATVLSALAIPYFLIIDRKVQ